MSKPDKYFTHTKNERKISLNVNVKILNKILINRMQLHIDSSKVDARGTEVDQY